MRSLSDRGRLGSRPPVVVAVVLAVALLSGSTGIGSTANAEDSAAATQPPPPGSTPLPVLAGEANPAVDAAELAADLAPLLADPALGPAPGVSVLDGSSGQSLLDLRAATPVVPASSLKIVTALAAFAAVGPQTRLPTRVVRDPAGGLVLVGGGDPTLLTLPPTNQASYPAPATLADLAAQTAAALKADGIAQVALGYDASLFTGPGVSPDWDPTFVGLGIVSPVSALTVSPASQQVDQRSLDTDPAATVASWFAGALASLGISVVAVAAATADGQAVPIAEVLSPPVSALVDRMLDVSDNDIAEALFRLAAIGRDLPGSFEGGQQAAASTIADLEVPSPGLVVRDGSGLSRANRIAPITLAAALQIAADPAAPVLTDDRGASQALALDVVTWLPAGLPVGGLTGSLTERFDTVATAAGAGRVRAKTGTLTGVTSLAGVVASQQGRPLVFAILGNDTTDTLQARDALDRIAAQLAACGCRASAP